MDSGAVTFLLIDSNEILGNDFDSFECISQKEHQDEDGHDGRRKWSSNSIQSKLPAMFFQYALVIQVGPIPTREANKVILVAITGQQYSGWTALLFLLSMVYVGQIVCKRYIVQPQHPRILMCSLGFSNQAIDQETFRSEGSLGSANYGNQQSLAPGGRGAITPVICTPKWRVSSENWDMVTQPLETRPDAWLMKPWRCHEVSKLLCETWL